MELWHERRSLVSNLTDMLRSKTPSRTRLSLLCPDETDASRACIGLALVQPRWWLPKQMSQGAVVIHDKESNKAPFELVIPPMPSRLTCLTGESL
jgi:hypothetical protein